MSVLVDMVVQGISKGGIEMTELTINIENVILNTVKKSANILGFELDTFMTGIILNGLINSAISLDVLEDDEMAVYGMF